jgi:site-specific DNA-methyltransferase (adenine-specific)
MAKLPDGCIDMVLTDPPYGTTDCKWDTAIPFEPMWAQLKRLVKPRSAIVLHASQPFTSALVMSNTGMYRHAWVWDKVRASGFHYARFQPMRQHEDILVFGVKSPQYDPTGEKYDVPVKYKPASKPSGSSPMTIRLGRDTALTATHRRKYSILRFNKVKRGAIHPTQKPVALAEYLIKTYTHPGMTVIDFTMGSGTTGVACKRLGRNFIGIELDAGYFEIAKRRIAEAEACQPGAACRWS